MDAAEIVKLPFVQVALPIMLTFVVATWYQNKRVDDVNRRLDELRTDMNRQIAELRTDMNRQFGEIKEILKAIQAKLENHNERITRLEERSSPIGGIRR